MRRFHAVAVLVGLAAGLFALPVAAVAEPLVFAAASLKNALDAVAARYESTSGETVSISYAGSAALARQIEQGAPADLFLSADLNWMDHLEAKGLIRPSTRVTLLGNRLVLVAPRDDAERLTIAPGIDLSGLLGSAGRLAMAGVEAVPAGRYGKAALIWLGPWDDVADRVVEADNVRTALAFVARGEAALGVVYATDAAAEPDVAVVGAFPAESHPPIRYPAALLANSDDDGAAAFLAFLTGAEARAAFEDEGFTVLGQDRPGS